MLSVIQYLSLQKQYILQNTKLLISNSIFFSLPSKLIKMRRQKHRSEMMQCQPSQMNNSEMKVSLIVQLNMVQINVMVQEQQAYHSVKVGSAPVLLQQRIPNVVSFQSLFHHILLISFYVDSDICC
jgi:hypothetical protein